MKPVRAFYRIFKDIGILGYNRKKNIFGMNPLLVSTLFLVLTATLAKLLRKAVKTTATDGFIKQLCMEFLATAELCAACFELAVIADNYGVWVYAFYLFLLCIWWSRSWENASACPYTPMEEVLDGCQNIRNAVLIIISQLMGGYVIFRYVQALWSLELAETHIGKTDEECSADLQDRYLLETVFIEAFSTFLHRLLMKVLLDINSCLIPVIQIFLTITLILIGSTITGPYMNPIMSTLTLLNCTGITTLEIFFIYWIGGFIGALHAYFIYNRFLCAMMCGAVIEGVATCLCRLSSRFLSDVEAKYSHIVDPFFATMMVVAAFNFSGGYFNPALATSLKFGCDGQTFIEFMFVYWFGSCFGAISSVFIFDTAPMKRILGYFKQNKGTKEE